jgi:hypothetical protein
MWNFILTQRWLCTHICSLTKWTSLKCFGAVQRWFHKFQALKLKCTWWHVWFPFIWPMLSLIT